MNPALTLAFAAAKRLPWKKVPVYWTAQVLGAFVASACVYGVYYGERKGIIWWIDCYYLSSTFVPFVGIFINVFFFLNFLIIFYFLYLNLTDALNEFDGGVRHVLGPKGTAGIWATYPQSFLSTGNGFGDQVNTRDETGVAEKYEKANPCWRQCLHFCSLA